MLVWQLQQNHQGHTVPKANTTTATLPVPKEDTASGRESCMEILTWRNTGCQLQAPRKEDTRPSTSLSPVEVPHHWSKQNLESSSTYEERGEEKSSCTEQVKAAVQRG